MLIAKVAAVPSYSLLHFNYLRDYLTKSSQYLIKVGATLFLYFHSLKRIFK